MFLFKAELRKNGKTFGQYIKLVVEFTFTFSHLEQYKGLAVSGVKEDLIVLR